MRNPPSTKSHRISSFLPLYYTVHPLVSALPTPPARHLLRHSLQAVAVAVPSLLAVQTPHQVVFLLCYRRPSRYARLRHMSGSATYPACIDSASSIRTNADFVADSLAAMTDYVSAGKGGVAHFPAVHTSHLGTGVGACTRDVSELLAIEALKSGVRTFEVAVCTLPAVGAKSLEEEVYRRRRGIRLAVRLALQAKEYFFSLRSLLRSLQPPS